MGQLIQYVLRDGYVLGEGAISPVIAARGAKHLPILTQVDSAAMTITAFARRMVESKVTRSPT